MTTPELMNGLNEDSMGRLRWRVLRAFGVLPCSKEAQRMTDAECLEYALHMALDENGGAGC